VRALNQLLVKACGSLSGFANGDGWHINCGKLALPFNPN